jgi:hypothetical protein
MKHRWLSLFAFSVILLSACSNPLISALAAQPGEILFKDDFSDVSGHWPRVSSPDGNLGIVNGAYRFQVLSPNFEVFSAPNHIFLDARVEADARRLAGPLQNLFGLACRAKDSKNFYSFAISSDGYYALGKTHNGKTTLIGQEMMLYHAGIVQNDGLNHLRFDCIGETLTGYINGQVVTSGEDSDFSSGEAGLVAGTFDTPGVEVEFDNFMVYKP